MKRIYGSLKMSWLRVVLFAAAAGIYTGVVMLVPALKDTSFQDIGIMFEWWVIFAVIIVVNCKKSLEAMLKCFVFFLISQPLVYAVEVLSGALSLDTALGYYRNIWLPMTFLTLPGGFIAYFCKKQNVFGAVVLGLGNTIQTGLALVYFKMLISDFPHHLISEIVCVASVFVMSFCIQKHRAYRLIAILLPVILTAAILVLLKMTGRVLI
ncbi:MAG: hypothetical protein MJ118_00675 [Clostridia bacterium]|nr:hypothetical protein [Clostridia bacterium]